MAELVSRLRGFKVPPLRIRTQIIVPFLLLMLILGVVGTYLTTSLVASSLEQRITEQLVRSEEAALDEAVRVQGQQLAGLRLVANTEGVDTAVATGDQAALRRLVVPIEINDHLGSLKIFNAAGRTLLEIEQPDPSKPSSLVFRSGTDLSAEPLVRPVLHGTFDALGDKYIGFTGSSPASLAATAPIVAGDRVVGGVLIATPVTALLRDMQAKSLAQVVLFDRTGSLIGSTLPMVTAETLDAHTRSYLDLAAPGRAVRRTVTVNGEQHDFQFTNFFLRQRPVAYAAVAISRQEVVAAGFRAAGQMTALFAAVVLLLLVIGYVLALRLTRPIEELVAGTQAITRGDLTRRIRVRRQDELGVLAGAFNVMTTDLQDRTRALNEQMRRLAALYQTSQDLGRQTGHGEMAEAILGVSLKVLGIEKAVLLARNAESLLLDLRATVGIPSEAAAALRALPGPELAQEMDREGQPRIEAIASPGDDRRPVVRKFAILGNLERALIVPLLRGDRNAGYLVAGVPAAYTLPQQDVEILQTIATEMALMLENVELRKTTELQAHRLEQSIVALEKISQALTAVTVGTDNLLRAVGHAAAEILEVPYASIHLRQGPPDHADIIVGCDSRVEVAGVRASGAEVARQVERPEQVLELDLTTDDRAAVRPARRLGLQRAIGVAMSLNGAIAGVLVVHMRTPRRLGRSEMRVLQTLANQAVIAIENAVAYEKSKALASTDPMTGVANHREFENRLDRELQRARKSREPLALIICDLDHFKEINDSVGHPAGDAVLRYLTQQVLVPAVRPKDVVARYGGDEFIMMLRGADGRVAMAVAERIRRVVASQPLDYEGQVIDKLSLSLGIACFPRDGETRQALVQAADQALYSAKRSGRNRVARSDDRNRLATDRIAS